jgi:hypothetical protein
MSDQIKAYLKTVHDHIEKYCVTCAQKRFVWIGETFSGDILACCSTCQHVIEKTTGAVTLGTKDLQIKKML